MSPLFETDRVILVFKFGNNTFNHYMLYSTTVVAVATIRYTISYAGDTFFDHDFTEVVKDNKKSIKP
jgi:hypothetical protein